MSNHSPALSVAKACVTRALGGVLQHGIHRLDPAAAEMIIQPNIQFMERDAQELNHNFLRFVPYILVPRTKVHPETKIITTSLSVRRRPAKGNVESQLSVGYGGYVKLEDAARSDEINPDTQEPELLFMESIYKCLNRRLALELGVRVTDESANHTEMQIAATHNVIVDHSDDAGRVRLGMIFLCMLPPGLDAYALQEGYEDKGYITLRDLKAKHWHELESWSRMVIESLLKNETEHNLKILDAGN